MADVKTAIQGMRRQSRTEMMGLAIVGSISGAGALLSAAACCVLPLGLSGLGAGSVGLATLVPFHWPLTAVAAAAVGLSWILYFQTRRNCSVGSSCSERGPNRTRVWLSAASVLVILSVLWHLFEAPLLRLLGGL